MSYFGTYYGAVVTLVAKSSNPSALLEPIESPVEITEPEFVDHVAIAISRLCQYAKTKVTE